LERIATARWWIEGERGGDRRDKGKEVVAIYIATIITNWSADDQSKRLAPALEESATSLARPCA
jgi:hypothetical protein